MFDLFRSREKSVRILLGVLLFLVAASMLLYLVPSGPNSGTIQGDNVIAEIGGDKVTTEELNRIIEKYREQHATNQQIAQLVPAVVNNLIWERAMAYKAREMGITTSDQEVADMIDLELGKGRPLDPVTYREMLAQEGLTVDEYEHEARLAFLNGRLEGTGMKSMLVSEEDAKKFYHHYNDKISIDWIKFQKEPFTAKVDKMKVDPAELKSYFDKNRQFFMTRESRRFDIVVAQAAHFIQAAKVSDETISGLYAANIDSYRLPERVNVRQILIKTQGKPKEDLPKLKAKAQDLLNQLKKGADFAAIATKNSEDTGTAPRGGDIGWVVRGQITEPEFENAAFSLKPGTLSDIITTQYGYHIIQVTAHEQARVRSLDEVKPELMAEAQKAQGDKDLAAALAACRADVAKAPSQVENIAKKYDLAVYHVDSWTPGGKLPSAGGIEMLMSATFVETPKGGISNIVDAPNSGDSGFVVMEDITPAHPAEFAEVQGEVEKRFKADEAAKMFNDWVAQAADRVIKKKESLQSVAKAMQGTYGTSAPFTRNGAAEGLGKASLLRDAFDKKVGAALGPIEVPGGLAIVSVTELIPATDFTPTQRVQAGEALESKQGDMAGPLYKDSVLQDLKRRGIAKINTQVIRRIVASYRST